jgi:hypothetical protein
MEGLGFWPVAQVVHAAKLRLEEEETGEGKREEERELTSGFLMSRNPLCKTI